MVCWLKYLLLDQSDDLEREGRDSSNTFRGLDFECFVLVGLVEKLKKQQRGAVSGVVTSSRNQRIRIYGCAVRKLEISCAHRYMFRAGRKGCELSMQKRRGVDGVSGLDGVSPRYAN